MYKKNQLYYLTDIEILFLFIYFIFYQILDTLKLRMTNLLAEKYLLLDKIGNYYEFTSIFFLCNIPLF
jgi:hypothetical protein